MSNKKEDNKVSVSCKIDKELHKELKIYIDRDILISSIQHLIEIGIHNYVEERKNKSV